jgi:hypothetical protein
MLFERIIKQGYKNSPKMLHPLKNMGARRETCSELHGEDPQILGATVQNLFATATWSQAIVHHRYKLHETVAPNSLRRNMILRSSKQQTMH